VNIAVLTPIYKPRLSDNELACLKHSHAVLRGHDTFLVGPGGLALDFYLEQFPAAKYAFFPAHCFASPQAYSDLLLSQEFYRAFAHYSHILILQQDCIVFRDELADWAATPYDYIGAPWAHVWTYQFPPLGSPYDGMGYPVVVGNGGLSLRRVAAFLAVLEELDWLKRRYDAVMEDAFYSLAGLVSERFLVPNITVAARFSVECEPRRFVEIAGRLPMGVHAWEKWDKAYWLEICGQQGIGGLV